MLGAGVLGAAVLELLWSLLPALAAAACSARICSQAVITWYQMSAGIVPPSTGAPPYSVDIDWVESRCPTQTQVVLSAVAPQNQASP